VDPAGDSPAAAASVRIDTPSARAEASARLRSRSACSRRHAARDTRSRTRRSRSSSRRGRRSRVTAERVVGRNLDQHDPEVVGILDPHLDQSPRLGRGFPDDRYSGRGQPVASRAVLSACLAGSGEQGTEPSDR